MVVIVTILFVLILVILISFFTFRLIAKRKISRRGTLKVVGVAFGLLILLCGILFIFFNESQKIIYFDRLCSFDKEVISFNFQLKNGGKNVGVFLDARFDKTNPLNGGDHSFDWNQKQNSYFLLLTGTVISLVDKDNNILVNKVISKLNDFSYSTGTDDVWLVNLEHLKKGDDYKLMITAGERLKKTQARIVVSEISEPSL